MADKKDVDIGDFPDRTERIMKAQKGDVVAFRLNDGRVKSAAIDNRDSADKTLKLVTVYGKEFWVKFGDVLWVKTPGCNWPSGVYKLLKGIDE